MSTQAADHGAANPTPAETPAASAPRPNAHHDVLIVGGGTAGLTVAARLRRARPSLGVAVIEPSDQHYYQPLWTLVGGGVMPREVTARNEADVMPGGVTWIRDRVAAFDPEANAVETAGGRRIGYGQLVVAAGIQVNWDGIPGLKESIGRHGVCSNYSYEHVPYTWECIRGMRSGNAIFTQPKGSIKCGGAPQKILYLAEDYFRSRSKVRDDVKVIFAAPGDSIFGVEKYRVPLEKRIADGEIETMFGHHLVEIRGEERVAVLERVADGERVEINYEMMHVTPPMSAPKFIAESPLANEDGWVEADQFTLRHPRFGNVWALGDCAGLPASKTGAAVRKQAPVVVKNMLAVLDDRRLEAAYNGYSSCPVVTGYGRLVLAEFDYDGQPAESFPFNQAKERRSMYLMKKHLLPLLYWQGMLKGRA
jgi:sulfide:quinone oxidoreductase